MSLGEAFISRLLQVLLERLASRETLSYFRRLLGIGKELEKWNSMLSTIRAVLNDAEEKQLTSQAVKLWLDDLRNLAYNVEDILDRFSTEMLQRQIKEKHGATTSKVWGLFADVKFNRNLISEIKKITDRLHEILEQKNQLGLNEGTPSVKAWHVPPSSHLPEGPMIGRDTDKTKIIDFLLKEALRAVNFHVVAIVGMPGVGKTTLARHVYDDDAVKEFNKKVWVSVSDDFNLERVTKAILEAATSGLAKEFKEFNQVQESLRNELAGKKFLIVLDDVWNTCVYDLWIKLQSPFRVGAPGSKIVVTTRDTNVANMMGSTIYRLGGISDDQCWEVFKQHSLLDITKRLQNFELIKEKIVAKCRGLPLVARTLGGLLRCKQVEEWEAILNNKMWSLSDNSGILPVLKLSYHHLPSSLKRCFAYCSLLPNDYEFREKQLILLWMAEGLIQQRVEDKKQLEEVGCDYFQELLSRSLFQKGSKSNDKYVMHDLVGDLARWAAGEICFLLEDKGNGDLHPAARHMSYVSGTYDGVKKFEAISRVKHLRTFMPFAQDLSRFPVIEPNYLTRRVTFDLLPELRILRVLSLDGYGITELPNSIGKLWNLRYLDLSYTEIKSLPPSTTTLCNLQTLLLEGCSKLKALPANMSNLISSRHLNSSIRLKGMPPHLGRLTNLQSLSYFVVGKGSDQSKIREIGSLLHLRGTLWLSRLENVVDVEDASGAKLRHKEKLDSLKLEWSDLRGWREMELGVLDMLQPPKNLKELTIFGYGGSNFSSWIGDPLFTNMVRVCLSYCENCHILPPVGQLRCLKELHIMGMTAVKIVGPEFYGKGSLPFRVLEILKFSEMEHWEKWLPLDRDKGSGVFPSLKVFSIRYCPKLEGELPKKLNSLAKLQIVGCKELVVEIANYEHASELSIDGCKALVHTSAEVDFKLLQTMWLSNILEPRLGARGLMKGLGKIKELKITGCEELTSSLEKEDRCFPHLISLVRLVIKGNSALVEDLGKELEGLLQVPILACKLEYLKINHCGSLSKLPKGLRQLSSLQELHINDCTSLVSFPDVGLPPSLKVLEIHYCPSLTYIAKYQIPQNLKRIEMWDCTSLKSLVEEAEFVISCSSSFSVSLEHLEIHNCSSLTSLSLRGQLYRALKHLQIRNCEGLELIASDPFFHDNTNNCLEYIRITRCQNLKSLPEGLCHLTNLQALIVRDCGSLVSIPRLSWERRASNLRQIHIINCKKLEVLPEDIRNLTSLKELEIDYLKDLTSFPPNLTSLEISKLKSCKRLWELERGLHKLSYLRNLRIKSEDPDVLSFPPDGKEEMLLPKSLTELTIHGFPNLMKLGRGIQVLTSLQTLQLFDCPKLKKLDRGIQFLTSLQTLQLSGCPNLASIPDEGLPLSLGELAIIRCPLLEERCQPGNGRYWPKVSHIPCLYI
ncbi:putative disease resistance RPP13-like protein 1 isoform X1 [Malus sylvestris]|nr:putative disease resistance RPP13-like protein 1 isoform X1 [Malus sylvestris]XP_050112813.1 putative disease resistance RPP13-like protein 1 isoform X1 [Malus sylvestris]XP_050112814.1 putative disease resistance RPP13-like protein 1 isoform X1 [Malus sylvestris]XP_050112815.1 putative disease resistance RPP13-like protein 1 isoform X1 [Malus sylvestris]XP_050112816.1 putative disease resistance RPP13-like protein 1 isoform X1 [Malus sylvestris]XP_050112817.1 putative disease resistance RP